MSASLFRKIYRYVWVSAWYAFAAVVVLLATTFAVARLLLPFAEQYSSEVGERFSQYLNQPVLVRALDAEWHGWEPSLVLQDVSLLDTMGEHPVLRLDKIRLGLNLLSSLRQRQLVFSNITLVGMDLVLTRNPQGQIFVAGVLSQAAIVDDTAVERGERQAEDAAPFLTWLFTQDRLSLENSDITWHDEMGAGRNMHFSAVNLTLRNDGDRHQLDATVALSRDLGKSLILRVDMQGDPLRTEARHTRIFVSGDRVRLAELFETQIFAGVDVSIQDAGFQLWGEWRSGVLQTLTGKLNARGLSMRSSRADVPSAPDSQSALNLDRMGGHFLWQRTDNGWQFEGDELLLARESRQWQPARMSLNFSEQDQGRPTVDVAVSYLQLEDISELLLLFAVGGERLQRPLQTIIPRGEINNAWLHWQGGKTLQYRAYATLSGATVNAWRNVPAAENVDGQLWLDAAGGQVDLQHAAVTLDFPALFRWPIQIDELNGHLSWEMMDDQWRISGRGLEASNADITASATLDVVQDTKHASPFMSLVVDFQDGDGSQVGRYLPTGIMSEAAINWLDGAFVSARIVSGGAIFHGQLENFPFNDGDGKFAVEFSVNNASLNYANDWPPVTGITADVRFEDRGMFINMHRGKLFSNQIRWAKIGIADMSATPLLLTVDGEVRGSTQEKLDYLVASPPLYAAFGQHLKGMSATGDSVLQLDLDMPIGGGDAFQVSGWVDLSENSLSTPPLGRVLSEVDGRLVFFQNGLQAENIHAELLGQAVQININTQQGIAGRKMHITADGLFNTPDLAAHYAPLLTDLLAGDGEWNVLLDIPLGDKSGSDATESGKLEGGAQSGVSRAVTLYVQANLKGVAARLPAPFDKQAEDVSSLELHVDFLPQQSPVVRVRYGGFADAVFVLGSMDSDEGLRAEIRFNAGAAVLPDEPGLRMLGWLEKASLDEWRYLLSNYRSQQTPGSAIVHSRKLAAGDSPLSNLHSADMAVRSFEGYGQQLHNFRVKLLNQDGALQLEIDSKELKGRVVIPFDLQRKPISAELSYCYLSGLEVGGGAMDPRDVPALDIRIDDFRYLKSRFGMLRLETTRVADGLRIEQLVLKPRSTTMTARGGWYMRGKQQHSNLQMHLKSSNIGRTLKTLDYVGGIDKGKGTVDIELKWPGSFVEMDVGRIQGMLKISLKDGYVLDIEPGAGGRLFGMLSIQTLPRRLLLDFSDVFKKGFGFDRLKGRFSIEDGDAYTNNFYMDGPAARIDISGRIGLEQQDYDQLVTVTPHVGESLPMIGILTATPQVGAIVLAIQKLFKPAIDNVTRNQYTITGSWDAPEIKKVKRRRPVVDNAEEGES